MSIVSKRFLYAIFCNYIKVTSFILKYFYKKFFVISVDLQLSIAVYKLFTFYKQKENTGQKSMFFIRDFDNLNSKLNYFYLYWKKFAVDVIKSSQSSVLLPILFFTICNISTSNHLKNGWISVDNCLWFTIVNLCAWLQGTSKLANVSR